MVDAGWYFDGALLQSPSKTTPTRDTGQAIEEQSPLSDAALSPVLEALDAEYVPDNGPDALSSSSPISLHSDDDDDGVFAALVERSVEPIEGVDECNYPMCPVNLGTASPARKATTLRKCPTLGCDGCFHHLCAIAHENEEFPPTCNDCFMKEGLEEEEDLISSQKHKIAAANTETQAFGGYGSAAATEDGSDEEGPMYMVTTPTKPRQGEPRTSVPATPPTPLSPMHVEDPPSVKRVSPAAPRSVVPTDPRALYGYCVGAVVKSAGDNSCFFHTARTLILDDSELSRDEVALIFIGNGQADLRQNISNILKGTIVLPGIDFDTLECDLRVGRPPASDPEAPSETIDDILSAIGSSMALKAVSVLEPNKWGDEVDMIIIGCVTGRVWQMGDVSFDPKGQTCFVPKLQFTPPDYVFDATRPHRCVLCTLPGATIGMHSCRT